MNKKAYFNDQNHTNYVRKRQKKWKKEKIDKTFGLLAVSLSFKPPTQKKKLLKTVKTQIFHIDNNISGQNNNFNSLIMLNYKFIHSYTVNQQSSVISKL